MSDDFYTSSQGSMAMHGAGRRLGQTEGYNEGLAEGIALGRQQANDTYQPQLNQLIQRVRELEARTWTDREKYFAMAVVALSAIESLGSATKHQQLAFLTAYHRLVSEAKNKQLLDTPPHSNPEFERANPVAAQFLNSMLATAMQSQADNVLSR